MDLIVERTRLALTNARRAGVGIGRPRLPTHAADKVQRLKARGSTWPEIAARGNVVVNLADSGLAQSLSQLRPGLYQHGTGGAPDDTTLIDASGNRFVLHAVPRFYGGEVGARVSLFARVDLNAAVWASYIENKTQFDADVAAFVPKEAVRRFGFDLSARARIVGWLDADLDLSQATLQNALSGAEIALAPRLYMTGGLTAAWRALRGGLRFRYLGGGRSSTKTVPNIVRRPAAHERIGSPAPSSIGLRAVRPTINLRKCPHNSQGRGQRRAQNGSGAQLRAITSPESARSEGNSRSPEGNRLISAVNCARRPAPREGVGQDLEDYAGARPAVFEAPRRDCR